LTAYLKISGSTALAGLIAARGYLQLNRFAREPIAGRPLCIAAMGVALRGMRD
jgi:hypothetical protein